MIIVMSTHPADNLDDHGDDDVDGDDDESSVYHDNNSMAFVNMTRWTKNSKAYL